MVVWWALEIVIEDGTDQLDSGVFDDNRRYLSTATCWSKQCMSVYICRSRQGKEGRKMWTGVSFLNQHPGRGPGTGPSSGQRKNTKRIRITEKEHSIHTQYTYT